MQFPVFHHQGDFKPVRTCIFVLSLFLLSLLAFRNYLPVGYYSFRSPSQELTQESAQELAQESAQDSVQESAEDSVQQSTQKSVRIFIGILTTYDKFGE
ncbi:hypothetical protein NEOLI_005304, partial [Neolecta irregularis DAH-3]